MAIFNEEEIEEFSDRLKTELGFNEVVFEKQVNDDLYFYAFDANRTQDRLRFRPSTGIVFTWVQGVWRQIPGFMLNN